MFVSFTSLLFLFYSTFHGNINPAQTDDGGLRAASVCAAAARADIRLDLHQLEMLPAFCQMIKAPSAPRRLIILQPLGSVRARIRFTFHLNPQTLIRFWRREVARLIRSEPQQENWRRSDVFFQARLSLDGGPLVAGCSAAGIRSPQASLLKVRVALAC